MRISRSVARLPVDTAITHGEPALRNHLAGSALLSFPQPLGPTIGGGYLEFTVIVHLSMDD